MDLRKIKKLIELLEESALVEMEITEGDNTIRLSRAGSVASVFPAPQMGAPQPLQATPPPSAPLPPGESASLDCAVVVPPGNPVESPMVGTYYDSPSPDTAPFVKIGSSVKAGDTLCVIEAMKTFNQIEAESDGTITAIHKSNGEPVEYGELLFTIT